MNHRAVHLALAFAVGACGRSSRETTASGEVAGQPPALAPSIARTEELRAAETAIASGHPWRATVMLAPILRDPKRRTPTAVVIAARAAAGWDGWTEVEHLLPTKSGMDSTLAAETEELLARAALARNADSAALPHARIAVERSGDPRLRGLRTVYLARALDGSYKPDSAAVLYERAAGQLPILADWLLLRAAGVERDSTRRTALYRRVGRPEARARIDWTEAQARERFGDPTGAAKRFAALGDSAHALRLRLVVAPDEAARGTIRKELLAFIAAKTGTPEARIAVDALDQAFQDLAPAEEVIVGRSAAMSGPGARAITAFGHAVAQPEVVTSADRYEYGQVLTRAGRARDAAAQFALVEGSLAGQAAYQRARILPASAAGKRSVLRNVANQFAGDTSAASAALFLLADFTVDDGDDAQARATYQELYTKYPTSIRASDARLSAALIALVSGAAGAAAIELDSIALKVTQGDVLPAAQYWSGRAWASAGDDAAARERWRAAVSDQPNSYYAAASARRLGQSPWSPSAREDSIPHVAAVDSAVARADLLEHLGMDVEARFEYDALEQWAAGKSRDKLLVAATALRDHGQPLRAMRLARRLLDLGAQDARTYRLLYPLPSRDDLLAAAKARHLDPTLVAGVIRQESAFDPRAVSVAGARGLMQVMPSVGESFARTLRYPVWYPVVLFDPEANLEIGTTHLAASVTEYGAIPRVLAAYNAGGARVARWISRPGAADPELFTERIPFEETRNYVRAVVRNEEMYRVLYGGLGTPDTAR